MVSRESKRKLKIIIPLIAVLIVILLVGNIYSAKDNHYVLDVIKETATSETAARHDDNLKITEKILRETTGELSGKFKSTELNYEVELENIAKADKIENRVAMVIDTSYSMGTNDKNLVAREKAKELFRKILGNANNTRIKMYNNAGTYYNSAYYPSKSPLYTLNQSTGMQTYVNNTLKLGAGHDSNEGLNYAYEYLVGEGDVNKYIIVFTDSTDNVAEKIKDIKTKDPNIKIITILVDMTSTSYIKDGEPIGDKVYLALDEVEESTVHDILTDKIKLLDMDEIVEQIDKTVQDIVIENTFPDEIVNHFDITDIQPEYETDTGSKLEYREDLVNSSVEKTDKGYKWSVKRLGSTRKAKLKFTLKLRYKMDIEAGAVFNEITTNKEQKVNYTALYNTITNKASPSEPTHGSFNGNDSTTEGTVIEICQGYDVRIKAVNESNKELPVEGIDITVIATNDETGEIIDSITRKTDSKGYITITADEATALRKHGKISYELRPSVNKIGYAETGSIYFAINNNQLTKKIDIDDLGNNIDIEANEANRLVDVVLPINSEKFEVTVKAEELNNSSVYISGSEFELIQPKLNSEYDLNKLSGTTGTDGTVTFNATVMEKDGPYTYILRQKKAPDGYEITPITLITIEFKDGKVVKDPKIEFNPDVKGEKCTDKENHVLITVGNKNINEEEFNLKINLSDINDGTKLDNAKYLVEVTNSYNQIRSELVTVKNGEANTTIYGNGDLRITITEQNEPAGYVKDTQPKVLIVRKIDGVVQIIHNEQSIDAIETADKDGLIVNLYKQKKVEQNILDISLVDADETDVPVGKDVVYHLTDVETGYEYPVAVSDRKGKLSFILDSKPQGEHEYILSVDRNTVPKEYDAAQADVNIRFKIVFDKDKYIADPNGINTIDGDTNVIDRHSAIMHKEDSVEYTAYLTIQYHMNISNTAQFIVQLKDKETNTPIEYAKYKVEVAWDINGETTTREPIERHTDNNGRISTRIVKGDEVRIFVTELEPRPGYTLDTKTQEIYLTYKTDKTLQQIVQAPYDKGVTNTDEPQQGAYEETTSGNIIFDNLNSKRSAEDTYINLTVGLFDEASGARVDGTLLNIKSDTLKDENGNPLNLIMKTGDQDATGEVIVNYEEHIKDSVKFSHLIKVPGIGIDADKNVHTFEICEVELDGANYVEKPGTKTHWTTAFSYEEDRVSLKNLECDANNILVKDRNFSSYADVGKTDEEDKLGVFLATAQIELLTNHDAIGNLAIDFKKENIKGEAVSGAKYDISIINSDGMKLHKEADILNGNLSSDIELPGLSVNEGCRIHITEVEGNAIGYAINNGTDIFLVKKIDETTGKVTIEHETDAYPSASRARIESQVGMVTSAGTMQTNCTIVLTDYQLDTFEFDITTKDSNSLQGVPGYRFKVDSNKGATGTLTTGAGGKGSTKVGGSLADTVIEYTVTSDKTAEYYKPFTDIIKPEVHFNSSGKVDVATTMSANQTKPGYGTIWSISNLEDTDLGKIGIEILVQHRDPLNVVVKTLDKVTNKPITGANYKIEPSSELAAVTTAASPDSIDVGYVIDNGIKEYKITQTSLPESYKAADPEQFKITYVNEVVNGWELLNSSTDNTITKTGAKQVTITIYVEPKVPFEITNLYYFDSDPVTGTKLQGSNFEVESLRNNEKATGTTDANGITSMYVDILGKNNNETVIYKVRQTKAAEGYAMVDDFYVTVTYNANREIISVDLTDAYGNKVTNNRYVTVSHKTTSTYSNYNNNNKGIVTIQVLNYPEFKFVIKNVDRRDGVTPIEGTDYSVKSIYTDSSGNNINFMSTTSPTITDVNGIATAHLDKTKDNTVVIYTIKENKPGTGYQSLGYDIDIRVTFDADGFVNKVEPVDTSLNKIAISSKIDPITDDRDRFTVNLELKNNPLLKFKMTKVDRADETTKINDVNFTIVSKLDDGTVYSRSSATNKVNKSESAEKSALTGKFNGEAGYTELYLDRTIDTQTMYYTIKETRKSPEYEWADEIILKVEYDANGKINGQPIPTKGENYIKVLPSDSDNFEINLIIYNDEIKEFGVSVTAVDAYDIDKEISDLTVAAWLTEEHYTTTLNHYIPDGKYELMYDNNTGIDNRLLTGADRNSDGAPDISYGQDYRSMGPYTEGAGTRTLRLTIQNKVAEKGGYYNNYNKQSSRTDNTPTGYYRGSEHIRKAYYQQVKYDILIDVTFNDEGRITKAKLRTGEDLGIGWLANGKYVITGTADSVDHSNYAVKVKLKLYPMFNLNLFAMDNYTYEGEVDRNGVPIKLDGSKYLISTQRHTLGDRYKDEYVTAGYIGRGHQIGFLSTTWVYGDIYEDYNSLYVPIEANKTRKYYVFEYNEPTNYHKYREREEIREGYTDRLVAIINMEFDEYGEMKTTSWKFLDRTDAKENGITTLPDGSTIAGANATYYYKPYQSGNGSYLSHNNIKQYNYWYDCTDHDTISTLTNRRLDFYIGYALTTKINVQSIDAISGDKISNIRMYPFVNNTYFSKLPYQYSIDETGYRDTNTNGKASWKYWGAAETNQVNKYIIGSSRIDGNYNGYLFPADMASAQLGGSGKASDYYGNIDVQYGPDGKISNVTSVGKDLWGDDNIDKDITWDPNTGNINIKMIYNRKFQMTLNKADYYDSTINKLDAKFDVISNRGLKTSISSKNMTPMGKVYKDATVTYTLSETKVPNGYYPLNQPIIYEVSFDKNGDIGKTSLTPVGEFSKDYVKLINTSNTTKKANKTAPDLTIEIKNKPAFTLDLRIIDQFYKNDGIKDIHLDITSETDGGEKLKAVGNPQTDNNGYAKVIAGPVYPGEWVTYTIKQLDPAAPGYYKNNTIVKLRVHFTDSGKIDSYSITNGSEVVNDFNTTQYMNTREISMQIMNMPKDLVIGFRKYNQLDNKGMPGVNFTITKQVVGSSSKTTTKLVTGDDGTVVQPIDTFVKGEKVIKYTIHEDETPATFRKMQDATILVYYNSDGSINSWHKTNNDDGLLNEDVSLQVAIGTIKKFNDTRVHMITEIPNDNAYDIIIKNEDTNFAGFGIKGSKFDVSINGETYTPPDTDVNGETSIKKLTQAGDIKINIAQAKVGDGYRDDIDNNIEIQLIKGISEYTLNLKPTTNGYVDDKNAVTTKATVEVDEEHGIITVTFKNETKLELTVIKQDRKKMTRLENAKFEIIAQQIDNKGNSIDGPITITTDTNNTTNKDGEIYFDLGVAPQSQIWQYTFKEITPPEDYIPNDDVQMKVTFDQYGKVTLESSNNGKLLPLTEHNNENCRSIKAILYNSRVGDDIPSYTVKVVTQDVATGTRINGSKIRMDITDATTNNWITIEPNTPASTKNGEIDETANLGIDGKKYTDEQVENEKIKTPIIADRGLVYIDNIDYEGTINIKVSQEGYAEGYEKGGQKTNGDVKVKAQYVVQTDGTKEVELAIEDNGGFGKDVRVDSVNRVITIIIKNESKVMFKILTREYKAKANEKTVGIPDVSYKITAEIQRPTGTVSTDVDVQTQLSSDPEGLIFEPVGRAFAGETVIYKLKQILPNVSKFEKVDDIKIQVEYDARGYISYYELLTSDDNVLIVDKETKDRTISIEVTNSKIISGYRLQIEKHALEAIVDDGSYGKTLPGATFKIDVQQAIGESEAHWVETTDENGLITCPALNGAGTISVNIEEIETPEGYAKPVGTWHFTLRRDPKTGLFEGKTDGNVNIEDIDMTQLDDFGNIIIKLKPVNRQEENKFTLAIGKYSNVTNEYIITDFAEFKAEIIKKDTDGNIIYQDTIDQLITDASGIAIRDNLDMPGEGEYKLVITELKAPEGYAKLSDPIEIPVTFKKKLDGNLMIYTASTEGLENVSILKLSQQILAINIGNEPDDVIGDDEYSLDITKVDAETGKPIENMAIFKVWLPDEKKTAVYTETMETLLGKGKLDYCYIEQDKDYRVRLTHMKLPEDSGTLEYTFKEIVPPEGYEIIKDELKMTIEFEKDPTTGEMIIKNATSSDTNYLRINTPMPCPTKQRISVDILNKEEVSKFTVHYDANDDGEGTTVPADQIKNKNDAKIVLSSDIPTRDGYTFKGWGTTATSTSADYMPGDDYTLNQDITLYAIWEENLYLKSTEYLIGTGVNPENIWKPGDMSEYKDGDLYIKGIRPQSNRREGIAKTKGTKISEFKNNLIHNADEIKIYIPEISADGEKILKETNVVSDENTLVATGMVMKLTKGTQEIKITLIVRGDLILVNNTIGNGFLDLQDLDRTRAYNPRINKNLNEEELQAFDFAINTDLGYMQNQLLINYSYQKQEILTIEDSRKPRN